MPRIQILMITYNRASYTRMSLSRLLDSCDESMGVWVWHNGDDAATIAVIKSFADHPRLERMYISDINEKLRLPTNWIFSEGNAPYVAKVDDDCLVQEGWAQALRETLESSPKLGIVACWHYQLDDFDETLAAPKIRTFSNGKSILQNLWVQGSGIMLKRSCILDQGLIPESYAGFTPYCSALAKRGWIMGWVLPLVLIEHMDDPRSPYSQFKTEEDFQQNRPLSALFNEIDTLEEWKKRVRWSALEVQRAPLNDKHLTGIHRLNIRLQRKLRKIFKISPPWLQDTNS